ncbi:MAG: hypothetical protein HETSPECPRED_007328 [Heterodermia speciosa]|uniref:Cytochrome P450 n=1 Tax=Heterodermia speciosa TaxID=116794 RepID=A0A8H3III1_9LECA|nr:MAG: hypothetical protein HETSPECPRED_007328 [Heterodermia speciosa]
MDMKHDMYIMDVVRKEVTRSLGTLQPHIINDMRESIDRILGTDTENWKTVPLYGTFQEILFKSSNRMFVGDPLCENKIFQRSVALFADFLGAGAVFVGEYLPLVLKPIFGYALAPPIYLAQTVCFRYLVPEIKRRMVNIRQQKSDPNFEWEQPKDMLMWIVIAAMNRNDPTADRPEAIAQGLLFLMLGGIQTSIFTATNVFLDLLSSPPSSNYYLRLREEIESVFTSDDWESQKAIAKLVCTDSTIRESLRMSPILTRTGMREVVKKGGVQFPNGQTVPKGAWLAMPAVAIHYDEKFYPEPETYKPFRFVPDAPKAAVDTALLEVEDSPKESQYKVLSTSLSSASPTFLGFGYGRHSWSSVRFQSVDDSAHTKAKDDGTVNIRACATTIIKGG